MDSTSYVAVLESSNQLLQHQTNLLIGFTSVLIAVFIIILGISWYLNTNRIKQELIRYLNDQFIAYREDQKSHLSELIEEEILSIKETLDDSMKHVKVELIRLYAQTNTESGSISPAIVDWSKALVIYNEIANNDMVRHSVENILILLKGKRGEFQLTDVQIGIIESNIESIPSILSPEKEEIKSLLQKQKTSA